MKRKGRIGSLWNSCVLLFAVVSSSPSPLRDRLGFVGSLQREGRAVYLRGGQEQQTAISSGNRLKAFVDDEVLVGHRNLDSSNKQVFIMYIFYFSALVDASPTTMASGSISSSSPREQFQPLNKHVQHTKRS